MKLGSFICPKTGCGGQVDVLKSDDPEFDNGIILDHRDCQHRTFTGKVDHESYMAAEVGLYDAIKDMPAEHVRNLLEIMLVGLFDVGLFESLSPEQAQGIIIFLNDLKHATTELGLDLSKRAVPGAWC